MTTHPCGCYPECVLVRARERMDAAAATSEAATAGWKPDWVVAPGVVLQECLEEMHLSPQGAVAPLAPDGASRGHCASRLRAVLAREPMTPEDAQILQVVTSAPARLWLALERDYRAGLAAGLTDTSDT